MQNQFMEELQKLQETNSLPSPLDVIVSYIIAFYLAIFVFWVVFSLIALTVKKPVSSWLHKFANKVSYFFAFGMWAWTVKKAWRAIKA